MHDDVNTRNKNGNPKVEVNDKFYVSYAVFYMMGILTQVPFHFFINAVNYWMRKFDRNHHGPKPFPPRPRGSSSLLPEVFSQLSASSDKNDRTPLQTNFPSSFHIVSQSSVLISFLVLTFYSNRFPAAEKRIVVALSVICILFGISTALTQVDTSRNVELFFAVSIITTTIMNFCSAMAMLSTLELLKNFPVSYYPALHSGHSICGIISSLIQVLLISTRLPYQTRTSIYFGLATLIIFISALLIATINKKSRYFIYRVNTTKMTEDQCPGTKDVFITSRSKMASGLLRTKWYYASFLFVQGSTAMIFPGITALVVSDKIHRTAWEDSYFRPVASFLIYHIFNLIGREAAKIVKTPKHGFHVMIPALLRVALVPLFIFCNVRPRRHLPVFFGDFWYIAFLAIFAFSEGIIINISFLAIPSVAKQDEVDAILILIPVASIITTILCSGFTILINNLL